jgi:phosphocarrier protein
MLAAPIGTTIEVLTSGPEAAALGDAIGQLVANKFGEEC